VRFGFATIPAQPFEELCDLVRHAEELGYARAWIPDQSFFKDPFVLLGALAQRVRRIGLGLGVVNPYTRHPAVVARGAATLAEMSGGRFVLAYGAGNRRELLERLGMDAGSPGERCREALRIVRRLLEGHEVYRPGPLWPMEGARLPFPAGPPVPLYLAARGRRVLRAAGEAADGVILGNFVTPEVVRRAMAEVRQGSEVAGRDPAALTAVGWAVCIVTDDPGPAREMLRASAGHMIATTPGFALEALGMDAGAVAAVCGAYRAGGAAATVPHVTPEMVDQVTLIGPPRTLVARLGALRDAGIAEFTVLMPAAGAGGSHGVASFDHRKNLERFAAEVAPHLRADELTG
jgi:5,10-methylenetetrahydromethanopterin reductase